MSRGTERWWRFMRIGTDITRIDPLGRDKNEIRVRLSELTPPRGGSKPGRNADNKVDRGRGIKNGYNPFDD